MSTALELKAIAERHLALKDGDGHIKPITVRIGAPEARAGHRDFACTVDIQGIEGGYMRVYGADSMQAIELALMLAERTIEDVAKRYVVTWANGDRYTF
ncbi:MAG: DUF6968 family protein [Burkholderiales bacterium]|nr:hypothetical protein [Betaproteobacteria bacterium]